MFYQILFSSQVKEWVIITYKHGIYELPNELPNDLRLYEIRKYQESVQTPYIGSLVPTLHAKMKVLSILAQNSE